MDEVKNVGAGRLKHLRASDRSMTFEDDYMEIEEGTRGLIKAVDPKGEIVGLEFIEPEEMWSDPDVMDEYLETLEDGILVTVIVPDSERLEAEAMLREEVGKSVRVLPYRECATAAWR
ncbi:MAG: hypothetical protein SA339_10490 [Methanomassiliicoccus sp.]|nr:hypothetical protein [Methanomassiliicoccus sp.]